MRRALVVGNWKMHGSRDRNSALVAELLTARQDMRGVDTVVCPPYPYLDQVGRALRDSTVALGAQNLAADDNGAQTGEVSAPMLADVGCRYVIVGHSERRVNCGEDDTLVATKVVRALANSLVPIVCVGETLAERDAGETLTVIERQLGAVLARCADVPGGAIVVAYEPVWAIGTGRSATPAQAQEVHRALRALIGASALDADAVRILYGGSVKPDNAAALFAEADIDGALVGGASLSATDFAAICQAAG